jgi:hippurate hydrolase
MTQSKIDLLAEAEALQPRTLDLRRRIHQLPELGNDLPETKKLVLEAIAGLDLEIRESRQTSGIVATLRGGAPGPTILLRGDMDALPMQEETGLEFASKIDGRMHSCGHDAHTSMLATAAHMLCAHRGRLKGDIKFMFQPGEEGYRGAKIMLDEGVIAVGGEPDAAFGIHVDPRRPSGVIGGRAGNMLAAADTYHIKIIGTGGHAARPHDANDPVPVACQLVTALQTAVTRRINVWDPIVLTVGLIEAGTKSNIIPEFANMSITLRSFSEQSRSLAEQLITNAAAKTAEAHDMVAQVEVVKGYPPTVNHGGFVDLVEGAVLKNFGQGAFARDAHPRMGSEDFSYVLQKYTGAFVFLGVAPKGVDPLEAPGNHSPRMMIDEDALATGAATHAAVAFEFLNGGVD